jgi:hypothetical protein
MAFAARMEGAVITAIEIAKLNKSYAIAMKIFYSNSTTVNSNAKYYVFHIANIAAATKQKRHS